MDGDVCPTVRKGGFELLDEQPLATNLRQRHIQNLVAPGGHADDLDVGRRVKRAQLCGRPFTLHHCETALAGGNSDNFRV